MPAAPVRTYAKLGKMFLPGGAYEVAEVPSEAWVA